MGKRKRNILFLKIFLLWISILSIKIPHLYAEDINLKEFLLKGLKYNLSLIRDAQVKYDERWEYPTGEKSEINIEWKYKYNTGKEYMKIRLLDESLKREKITVVSIDYLRKVGFTLTHYIKGALSKRAQGHILKENQMWRFTNRGKPSRVPPSSLFWLIWPGVTMEEILSNPQAKVLSEKEYIEEDECFVVYLEKFWKKGDSRYERRHGFGYKIWICPEKGFFPRKIEIWIPGRKKPLYIFGPIVLKKFKGDIWFPIKTDIVYPFAKKSEYSKQTIEYTDIKINQGIKDEEFGIKFPKGTEVYDERTGIEFIAK